MRELHTDLHILNALVYQEFKGALVTGVQMGADGTARIVRAADADAVRRPGPEAGVWYELTWGNRVNTRAEFHELAAKAGLRVAEETTFSRFYILVATRG